MIQTKERKLVTTVCQQKFRKTGSCSGLGVNFLSLIYINNFSLQNSYDLILFRPGNVVRGKIRILAMETRDNNRKKSANGRKKR